MKEEHLSLGPELPKYFRFLPDSSPPRGAMVVSHGLAEHAARYRRLAEALSSAGWAVYAYDQRGHGHTAGSDEVLGHIADDDGWDRLVQDLRAFVQHARGAHPERPVVALGHSMGSLVLQDYLGRFAAEDLAGAALSGTSGPPPAIATVGRALTRLERLRQGPRSRSKLIDQLAFGGYNKPFKPARTDFDWLSRDPEEVDAYVQDPWCGFEATNETWMALLDALPTLAKPARLARIPKSLPIYLFSGDRDPVGQNGHGVRALAERYRRAGLTDVVVKLYDGGRHEMLNETNRDEVISDVLAWLEGRVGAEPAG
jgi:alpha-beta hydrolase superfamily lysophospholipase